MAKTNQAQHSSEADHTNYWRQNYRVHWRKQWLADNAAKPSLAQKTAAPVKAAAVVAAQTASGKQTHSSAAASPAIQSSITKSVAKSIAKPAAKPAATPIAKADSSTHKAASNAVTPQHPAIAVGTKSIVSAKSTVPAKSAVAAKPIVGIKPVASATSAASAKPVPVGAAAATAAVQISKPLLQGEDVLAQTRQDPFSPDKGQSAAKSGDAVSNKNGSHLQDNPFAPVGDAWKMLAYLVPMLLVIVGCLNLLKRFQVRTGRLPGGLQTAANARQSQKVASAPRTGGLWNALLGGFHLNNAREQAGSSIRVLESVPIGGANVHLLEVRGRVLLLGASAGNMNLLAEFEEGANVDSDDFRGLMHAAAADMDALDYVQTDLPAVAAMSVLEDLMRDTGQAITQNSRRLRTVQEVEGETWVV